MNLFDTNVKPEEDAYMFSVENILMLWTSNETREEEPVLFSIRDKADNVESIDQLFAVLIEEERSVLEQLLYDEQKWCEETLDTESLNDESYQQVIALNQSYKETIEFVESLKVAA